MILSSEIAANVFRYDNNCRIKVT